MLNGSFLSAVGSMSRAMAENGIPPATVAKVATSALDREIEEVLSRTRHNLESAKARFLDNVIPNATDDPTYVVPSVRHTNVNHRS